MPPVVARRVALRGRGWRGSSELTVFHIAEFWRASVELAAISGAKAM